MDGLGGRHQRPVRGLRSLGFWGVIVSALVVLSALFAPAIAGAQDESPVVVPGFCGPLSDVLNNAYQIPEDDEEYEQQRADGAQLLVALRPASGPEELSELIDALEAFSVASAAEIEAAGGIAGLTEEQRDRLIDESRLVLDPIDVLYEQSCPGANVDGLLYPECDIDGEVQAPLLVVFNSSRNPVEVEAGEIAFVVASDDADYRDVPADLQPDDVLIDGVSGLVEVGSCDDFQGDEEDGEFASYFVATFTPGCPDDVPAKLPRLKIGLTPEGQESLDEVLETEPGPFPVLFEVDDYSVIGKFPGGLNLLLEADATVPEVSIEGFSILVELNDPNCDPVSSTDPTTPPSGNGQPSAPGSTPSAPSAPGGDVAAPLAPKFTG